jgi:histone H3/H4
MCWETKVNLCLTKNQKTCYVAIPYDQDGRTLFRIIEPVLDSCGYRTLSAETLATPDVISIKIIESAMNASLFIADLSGGNPNIFYELGIRHATRKPSIELIQEKEKIPFDLASRRYIVYSKGDLADPATLRRQLVREIRTVEAGESLDSPFLKVTHEAQKAFQEIVTQRSERIMRSALMRAAREGRQIVTERDVKDAIKELEG